MSDKEIIIRSLETVERRIRTNHLLRELTLAFSVFLLIPIAFKTWDLFRPFRGLTVSLVLAVWFAGVFAYVAWRISHRSTLAHTAAAIDRKARLRDELKSAYWFATHPAGVLRGDWVELQVRRAALRATQLNVDQLYPRVIPTTSYMAIGLIVLLVGLNFLPLSTNHNWFYLEAAPAFTLTSEELRLIDQTKQLLKQAEQLEQPELVKQLEEIVQNLQEGNIDPAEALRQLEELKNMLGEGNLDVAALNEGLDEMANDLSGSPETSDVSKAMSEHDLEESAEELRKLAAELKNSDDAAAMQAVQNALQQASENSSAGMQKLAEDMKNAADGLAAKDSQAVQDALNQAAKDLQDMKQKIEEQQAKNSASQEIQNLQDSLRQRQQEAQQANKGAPQGKGEGQGEAGENAEEAEKDGTSDGDATSSQAGSGGQEGQQPGQNQAGDSPQAGAQGGGQNPSGAGNAPMEIMGAATKLNVQLEQEKLTGLNDGGTPEDIEEASKQERSKLDYRNVRSELSPAQKDVLNQDKIPWEYRDLIKNYFQAS